MPKRRQSQLLGLKGHGFRVRTPICQMVPTSRKKISPAAGLHLKFKNIKDVSVSHSMCNFWNCFQKELLPKQLKRASVIAQKCKCNCHCPRNHCTREVNPETHKKCKRSYQAAIPQIIEKKSLLSAIDCMAVGTVVAPQDEGSPPQCNAGARKKQCLHLGNLASG